MSDVGLDASLELDIRRALGQVDRLNEALGRATTGIVVTADTRSVTAAIDAAVANANTAVTVTGDAVDVQASIDAAVDAADTQLSLFADAADITGSVNAAVDAADTHVVVTADTDQAVHELRDVEKQAGSTAEGVGRLRAALGALTAGAIAKGLFELASANADLGESVSKATNVFGPFTNQIIAFSDSSAEAVGLSRAASLEAAGTFGNLLTALGLTQQQAARTSPEIVTLAADLASFNNLGVDETLEKIRSGLVGEVEPLRSLGISFNAAEVEAKAFELGLASANGEVSEAAKVQARLAIITEQTKNSQGDFAETSAGLANQQRILAAELQNTAIAAGEDLVPMLLGLITLAREEFIPRIEALAEQIVPALGTAFSALAEGGGLSLLNLLEVLAPVLQALAVIIDAIPAPVLAMVTTMLSLLRVVTLLSPAFNAARQSGQGIVKALTTMNPWLIAAVAAVTALSVVMGKNAEQAAEQRRRVEGVRSALAEAVPTVDAYAEALDKAAKSDEDFADALNASDLTASGLATSLATGVVSADDYRAAIDAVSDAMIGKNVVEQQALTIERERVQELERQATAIEDAAQAELDAGLATGLWTQAQLDAAIAATLRADESENVTGALQRLRDAEQKEQAEAKRTLAAYEPLVAQYVETGEALDRVRDASPEVASQLQSLRLGAVNTETGMLDLVRSLDDAALSEEAMGDVAALLGTDLETLQGFVDGVTDAIDTFASTAEGALPTVSDIFGKVADDGEVSAARLTSQLRESANHLRDFREDLRNISDAGFADLAALIAEQGPQVGGALADELNTALEEGNTKVLEGLSKATEAFNTEWTDTADYFRDVLGPEFILTSGLIGEGITTSFGEGLDFEERVRVAARVAGLEMESSGKAIATIAAVEGEDAAREYGKALNLDERVLEAGVAAGLAIGSGEVVRTFKSSGVGAGASAAFGVYEGLNNPNAKSKISTAARQLGQDILDALDFTLIFGSPSKVMHDRGVDVVLGLAGGIADAAPAVQAAMTDVAARITATPLDASAALQATIAGLNTSTDIAVTRTLAGDFGGGSGVAIMAPVTIELHGVSDPAAARAAGRAAADAWVTTVAQAKRELAIEDALQ